MDEQPGKGARRDRALQQQEERLKELACINRVTLMLREGKPVEETLQQLVLLLPTAMQYPDQTAVRIIYGGKSFETPKFSQTEWKIIRNFQTIDAEGTIEIF